MHACSLKKRLLLEANVNNSSADLIGRAADIQWACITLLICLQELPLLALVHYTVNQAVGRSVRWDFIVLSSCVSALGTVFIDLPTI